MDYIILKFSTEIYMPKRKYSNLSEFTYDYNLETESDENKDNDDSTEITEVKKLKSFCGVELKGNETFDELIEIENKEEKKKLIKLASEPDEFEVIEVPALLGQYEDWKKENPKGTYEDFLEDSGLLRVSLKEGGSVEDYGKLIDASETTSLT